LSNDTRNSQHLISHQVGVIAALVISSNEGNSKPKFRLFVNAVEMELGAEIINKSKMVRNQFSSRLLFTAA
jgi:hypothetical protein